MGSWSQRCRIGVLRDVLLNALTGPHEGRQALIDLVEHSDRPRDEARNLLRVLITQDPVGSFHGRLHRALQGIRGLHCAGGHQDCPEQCVGVMAVDRAGVHLACGRCGDRSHVPDADGAIELLLDAVGLPADERVGALPCGCPDEEVRFRLDLCPHAPGRPHGPTCVPWCERHSEGGL